MKESIYTVSTQRTSDMTALLEKDFIFKIVFMNDDAIIATSETKSSVIVFVENFLNNICDVKLGNEKNEYLYTYLLNNINSSNSCPCFVNNPTVIFTGHSLGGGLATAAWSTYKGEKYNWNARLVTFASTLNAGNSVKDEVTQFVATSFEGRDIATWGAKIQGQYQDDIRLEKGKSVSLHKLANYVFHINENNNVVQPLENIEELI